MIGRLKIKILLKLMCRLNTLPIKMVKREKSIGLITTVVECDSQNSKMVPITFTPHATPVITYLTWQKGFCICN